MLKQNIKALTKVDRLKDRRKLEEAEREMTDKRYKEKKEEENKQNRGRSNLLSRCQKQGAKRHKRKN